MKKVIAGLLSVAMIAAMAGCNKTPAQSSGAASTETKAGESKPAETTAGETTTAETTAKATYGEGPVHINMWSFSLTPSSVRSTPSM